MIRDTRTADVFVKQQNWIMRAEDQEQSSPDSSNTRAHRHTWFERVKQVHNIEQMLNVTNQTN